MPADLEARLRRLFARLDTAAGFEIRLHTRIAAEEQPPAVPAPEMQRTRLERERRAAFVRRMRRLYLSLLLVAGAGIGALVLARFGG
jgi:hypothetical protein